MTKTRECPKCGRKVYRRMTAYDVRGTSKVENNAEVFWQCAACGHKAKGSVEGT